MKQYINKSDVIAKIRSLQDSTVDEEGNFYTAKAQAEYNVLCMLENFLDTLEVKDVDEEPVSNDLEEAATKYARKQLSNPDYPTYNDEHEMECAFEAGAQWQKEQMIDKAFKYINYQLNLPSDFEQHFRIAMEE